MRQWLTYRLLYEILAPSANAFLSRFAFGRFVRDRAHRAERRIAVIALPNPLRIGGIRVFWYRSVCWHAAALAAGKYERETVCLLQDMLRPGMIFLDCGAHIGYFSLIASRNVGTKGKVYAFEPQPVNCEVLLKSARANGYDNVIVVVPKAISNESGMVTLHLSEAGDEGASLYESSGSNRPHRMVVESTTLDEFLESEGWPQIDVIKMDIEGSEKAALEGARRLIGRSPRLKMIIEFGPGVQANAGVSADDLFSTLIGVGFEKFLVIQNGLQPVKVPEDIPRLVKMADDGYVNLLCEK